MKTSSSRTAPDRVESLSIRFWGVRGSIPVPGPATALTGGNTACVEVTFGNERLILDAGTGIRNLGNHLLPAGATHPLQIDLLLSHLHWDHIQGLPFFAPIYHPETQLRIIAPGANRKKLADALKSQMAAPHFPVAFKDLPSRIKILPAPRSLLKIGSFRVESSPVNHPFECLGYRLTCSNRSICYLPDNELALRLPKSSRITLSDAKLRTFVSGADLLIIDAQYELKEYRSHVGWGHGCLEDVIQMAVRAKVKHLSLFHHDPDHDDRALRSMLTRARQLVARLSSPLKVSLAVEGLTLEVGSSK